MKDLKFFFDLSMDVVVATSFVDKIYIQSTPCVVRVTLAMAWRRHTTRRVIAMHKLPDSMDAGEPIK